MSSLSGTGIDASFETVSLTLKQIRHGVHINSKSISKSISNKFQMVWYCNMINRICELLDTS